jgi:hypothetical protein
MSVRRNRILLSPLAAVLIVGLATPAWAVDGVIEINQVSAKAGGVTPGDTPLFPVTISQPGLVRAGFPLAADPAKRSGQVTRLLRRLHVHQLVAKIPRARRWRVSLAGRRVMAAAVKLREVAYPSLYAEAA